MEQAKQLLVHYIRLAAEGNAREYIDPEEIESIVDLIMDEVERRIQTRIEQALADCGIQRPI
jgi:HEAT repeat protein